MVNKTISSQPGAGRFRSIFVVTIILVCIGVFLDYTSDLSIEAEQLARQKVVIDIEYSLAMMLYDYSIKGRLRDLEKFHQKNPFVPLAIYRTLPLNYHGAVVQVADSAKPGWYFEMTTNMAVYVGSERFVYSMDYVLDEEEGVGFLKLHKKATSD